MVVCLLAALMHNTDSWSVQKQDGQATVEQTLVLLWQELTTQRFTGTLLFAHYSIGTLMSSGSKLSTNRTNKTPLVITVNEPPRSSGDLSLPIDRPNSI